MTHDLAHPLDPATAAAWLRDLLHQLGERADAVLTEVLAGRDVRSLRVVGPLTERGRRFSLGGEVGQVRPTGSPTTWVWEVPLLGAHGDGDRARQGAAPTRLAADRALCLALQELGWAPVEVPTEEEAAAAPVPPESAPPPEVRTMEDIVPGINAQLVAIRLEPELSVDWAESVRAANVGSRAWQQEYQQQPVPLPRPQYVRVAEVAGGEGVRFEYLNLSVAERPEGYELQLRNEGGTGMGYDILVEPDPEGDLLVEWEGTQTRARRADTEFLWPERTFRHGRRR